MFEMRTYVYRRIVGRSDAACKHSDVTRRRLRNIHRFLCFYVSIFSFFLFREPLHS